MFMPYLMCSLKPNQLDPLQASSSSSVWQWFDDVPHIPGAATSNPKLSWKVGSGKTPKNAGYCL